MTEKDSRYLIVGLGLMGGGYAQGLSSLGMHVAAIDRDPDSIAFGIENGYIEKGSTDADPSLITSSDRIIFALYPEIFIKWMKENAHLIRPGTLLTDVTGVKSPVVSRIQELLPEGAEFIASHPMAGREVYGVRNSSSVIFKDANFIITPTEKNTEEGIEWCRSLAVSLGFRKISVISPAEHDYMIAFVSQLTHCIAVTLMTCNNNTHLADYTADSFRDLTRIANINDEMWSSLFIMNKEFLLEQMDCFIREFGELRDLVENEDYEGLKKKMRLSSKRRKAFDLKEKQ